MVLVIPEALTLASIIWGFKEIIQWLIALGSRAISAAQHCVDLHVDMVKMKEWVEKVRIGYKVSAYVGNSLMSDLTIHIHGALDDVLLACNKVESLANRITSGHGKPWRALINSSQLKKDIAKLEEEKKKLEGLQTSIRFAQEIQRDEERERERERQAKLEEKTKTEYESKEKAEYESMDKAELSAEKTGQKRNKRASAFKRATEPWDTDSSPPPSYSSATQSDSRPNLGNSRQRRKERKAAQAAQRWAAVQTATKTVGGAGLGGLGVVGIVALCNPVGGLAAIAGVTVYGLVAAGTLGGAAMGWAATRA